MSSLKISVKLEATYLELKRWTQDGKTFIEYQVYLEGMPVYKVIHEAKQ